MGRGCGVALSVMADRVGADRRACRAHDSLRRAIHSGPCRIRKDPARTHRGATPVAFGPRALLHQRPEENACRARAAPVSQGSSTLCRPRRQRDGNARFAEPCARSELAPLRRNDRNSRAGREWFDRLPIQDLETEEVFGVIHAVGRAPHWACAAGMSRVSCSFCILASRADLRRAAEPRPVPHPVAPGA